MILANKVPAIDEVVNTVYDRATWYVDQELFANPSYEKGLLGFSLFYAYAAKDRNDIASQRRAEECFEKALATLHTKNLLQPHLAKSIDYSLSQVGRYIQFVSQHNLLDVAASDYLIKLDEILFGLMKTKISMNDFDPSSGALAAAHYFLSRMRTGIDFTPQLSYLVHGLKQAIKQDKEGDYYWSSPNISNRVYLGISHGSAAIISLLTSLYELGVERILCAELLHKAVNFLLKQYLVTPYKGVFPNKIGDEIEARQFALCYGDLGIGYALLKAAKVLQLDKLEHIKNLVLEDCLLRTREDNLTLDAGIYYGAAGLGIAFDKIGHISSDNRFKERATYWYEQIPYYAIHDQEFSGFKSRLYKDEVTWDVWNVSFGWGILGIGTALMQFRNKALPALADLTFVI